MTKPRPMTPRSPRTTGGARSTPGLIDYLAALGDLTRLRLLRLLEAEELGVGELARVVQMPQSTVSRHLKMLLDDGWIVRRSQGTASLYRMVGETLDVDARRLWEVSRDRLARTHTDDADAARLREVLALRHTDSRSFFGRLGGEWDAIRRDLFGNDFTAQALLALVNPEWVVADVGCGTGNASEHLAPLVKRVIAIDRESSMLDAARKRLGSFTNVDFRAGDLARLPLRDQEVDAAVVFLVLHHVSDAARAVVEIARTLKPGGVLLIVDMLAHDRESYRHTMGHQHLGFAEKDVRAWARGAGLGEMRFLRLRPDTAGQGPGLFVATMRR